MGIKLSPFSHEMIPPSEEIPCCPHFGGIDIGLGDHTSPEQYGDFSRIDLVIFCFAAVDGFHVKGMTQDKGNPFLDTKIGDPIPGEHALHGDDNVLPERVNGFEEDLTIGDKVSVQSDFSCLIQDAEIHFVGMQVDSAIKFVLFGVESHLVSSYDVCLPQQKVLS